MLVAQLFLLQVDQLAEGHSQDGVGLDRREGIFFADAAFLLEDHKTLVAQGTLHHRAGAADFHQPQLGLGLSLRRADDADHLVDVGMSQKQAFEGVLALAGLGQKELRSPADDQHTVADELFENFLEGEHPRLAVDQGQEDDRESVLQRRELVELVEHDVGVGVALEVEHQTHRVFQIALVANARDARNLAVGHGRGDALFDAVAGLLIGYLADDDTEAFFLALFDPCAGANHDRATAGVIAATDAAAAADDAAGGEIGAGTDFHQFVDGDVRVVDHADDGIANFGQIVRRNRRGHAHGDAVGAVDQEVGELRRQNAGLGAALVVGG